VIVDQAPFMALADMVHGEIFDDDYVWRPWLVDSRCAHASLSPLPLPHTRLDFFREWNSRSVEL
jgi:hypothetical protein